METTTISAKPLTREETKMFLTIIESSKIIYDKSTNATTNKMKTEEWKRIADKFNTMVTTSHRTPQQLRLKWENLKKNSRRRKAVIHINNTKTGDGSSYAPPDEILDKVAALLGLTVEGSTVACGGDAEVVTKQINIGCLDESDSDPDLEVVTSLEDTTTISTTEDEALEDFVFADPGDCSISTLKPEKSLFTPRTSDSKRKPTSDENRAARNQALANYYSIKAKILEANLENILLKNKKLKLEIEKLKNKG